MTGSLHFFPNSEALKKRRLSDRGYFIRITLICVAVCLSLYCSNGFAYDVKIIEDTTTEIQPNPNDPGHFKIRVVNELAEVPHAHTINVILKKGETEVQHKTLTLDNLGYAEVHFDIDQGEYEIFAEYPGDDYSQSSYAVTPVIIESKTSHLTDSVEVPVYSNKILVYILMIAGLLFFVAYHYRSRIAVCLGKFRPTPAKLPPLRKLEKQLKPKTPKTTTQLSAEPKTLPDESLSAELMRKHIIACFETVLSRKKEVWGHQSPSSFAKKHAPQLKEKDATFFLAFCQQIEEAAFNPKHTFSLEETRLLHQQARKVLKFL